LDQIRPAQQGKGDLESRRREGPESLLLYFSRTHLADDPNQEPWTFEVRITRGVNESKVQFPASLGHLAGDVGRHQDWRFLQSCQLRYHESRGREAIDSFHFGDEAMPATISLELQQHIGSSSVSGGRLWTDFNGQTCGSVQCRRRSF
jgi:hypothetical protein